MGPIKKRSLSEGEEFHVADAYIWAQIYYLDSPTDYREHLPDNDKPQGILRVEPMVLLDCSIWTCLARFISGGITQVGSIFDKSRLSE